MFLFILFVTSTGCETLHVTRFQAPGRAVPLFFLLVSLRCGPLNKVKGTPFNAYFGPTPVCSAGI